MSSLPVPVSPVIRTVESVGPTLAIRERTAFRDLDVPTNFLEHRSLVDLLAMFSAEFEVLFVDFQGLDPALERGWRNSKLGRCSGRSRNPASSLTERRFDNLPFASPLNVQNRRRFNPNRPRGSPSGEPQLIN